MKRENTIVGISVLNIEAQNFVPLQINSIRPYFKRTNFFISVNPSAVKV
jgi:hypothetical protein